MRILIRSGVQHLSLFGMQLVSENNVNLSVQLHNIVYALDINTLEKLSERLRHMRECSGASCERYSSSDWEQHLARSTTVPPAEDTS